MFNNILRILAISLFSLGFLFNVSSAPKNNFNWGAKPKNILEEIQNEPYFKNEDILGYANQIISGQPCDIWYTFYKNKLWRKVVAFYDNSDNIFNTFNSLLSNKYGETLPEFKGTVWKVKNTIIILKKDSNYVRIIYINSKVLKNPYREINKLLAEEDVKIEQTTHSASSPTEAQPKA